MEISDIKAPFASQGDRETFDYEQTSNELSWLGGYTYLYGLKPEETDKNPYILREKFNEIMYLMSGKMLQNEARLNDLVQETEQQGDDLANLQGSLGKEFVTLNTQQNITALKTFNNPPQTQTNPVSQDDLVRLGFLQSGGAGLYVNGSWSVFGMSPEVNYTNTSGKPIFVALSFDIPFAWEILVNNLVILKGNTSVICGNYCTYMSKIAFFVVPEGATYKIVSKTANYKITINRAVVFK